MKSSSNESKPLGGAKPAYYFYHHWAVWLLFKAIDSVGFIFFSKRPRIVKPVGKILVINLGGAGDLIISEPFLSALADFSEKKVDLVCFPGQEKALLGLPGLGEIFYCELPWLGGRKKIGSSLVDLWRLSRILRQRGYSVAVDIKGDPLIILLMLLAKIPQRVGFSNGGLGFLLTHPFSQPKNLKRFKIDLFLAEAFEGKFENYNRPPHLSLPERSVSSAKPDSSPSKKIIVVHLGASVQARRWPLVNWVELLSILADQYEIKIIGSPHDSEALFSLAPKLSGLCGDFSGQPWAETAKTIKSADVFVGANSGPGHLAAALSCPVVSIFSAANDPEVWAPPGAKVLAARPACRNCELDYCPHLSCLKEITPLMVNACICDIIKISG